MAAASSPSGWARPMRAWNPREYFGLRETEQACRELAADAKRRGARLLRLGQQRVVASESLWAAGARAEALALSRDALDAVVEAVPLLVFPEEAREKLRDVPEDLGVETALRRLGMDREQVSEVLDARDARGRDLPAADVDVRPRHAERHLLRQDVCQEVIDLAWPRTLSGEAVARLRRIRAVTAATAVLGLLGCLALGICMTRRGEAPVEATASAYRTGFGQEPWMSAARVEAWPPDNAIDRDEMTFWQLPPGEVGWLEVRLIQPRDITALRILNGHDLHADDGNRKDVRRYGYSSEACVVIAYAGEREVARQAVTLPPVDDFGYVTVALEARRVDRVRVHVESFRGNGGAIAEVEVVP